MDQYFDTKPWLMIIMIMLGSAAGITNVMRAAKQLMPSETRNEHDKK